MNTRKLAEWPRRVKGLAAAAASLSVVVLSSCVVLPRISAVPESLTEQATVPGIPDSRLWFDRDLTPFVKVVTEDLARERAAREHWTNTVMNLQLD